MRAGIAAAAAAGGLQYTVVEITLSIILVWKRDIDVKVGCGVVLYVNEG